MKWIQKIKKIDRINGNDKWKYLLYFQNNEFDEFISKEILCQLNFRKERTLSLKDFY